MGGEDEKDGKAGGWTVKSRVGWKEGGERGGEEGNILSITNGSNDVIVMDIFEVKRLSR